MTDTAASSGAPDVAPQAFATARDRHLFGPGPKQILALDGGGVRGAITLGFLERMEQLLDQKYGRKVCLGDHFDLVGGTSTGAIIAGAIALGYRTEQVREFYQKLAPFAFKRQRWAIPLLQAKFDARGLRKQIEDVVGSRVLSSPDLITGFGIVTKRMDTGSPWIISNNPKAPYWEDAPGYIGNKHYPLVNLVRASTAAPHFFDPELLPISVNEEMLPDDVAKPFDQPWLARASRAVAQRAGLVKPVKIDPNVYGLFVDGGVTPHGSPALALLQMATLKPFGIAWPTTPQQLSVVSIGTGSYRPRMSYETLGFARFAKLAYLALMSLMTDTNVLVLQMMQWMGECPDPWVINTEIGTLANDSPPGGKMFRFLRYDAVLDQAWLEQQIGYKASQTDVDRLRNMDDPGNVRELLEIGRAVAAKQVKADHWS